MSLFDDEDAKMTPEQIAERDFRFGRWMHYKGGLYTAIAIVSHHATRKPMVYYLSQEHGSRNVRPLFGWREIDESSGEMSIDPDGWLNEISFSGSEFDPNGIFKKHVSELIPEIVYAVPRFWFVGYASPEAMEDLVPKPRRTTPQ